MEEGKDKLISYSAVCVLGSVSSLVVKRNAGIITASTFRHHLRLGTRTAGKISIASNWGQTGTSSEIVIREGLESGVVVFGRTVTAV